MIIQKNHHGKTSDCWVPVVVSSPFTGPPALSVDRQEMPDKATSKQVAQWQPGGSPKLDALVADLVRDFHLPNPFQAGLCRDDAKGAEVMGCCAWHLS